MKKKKIIVIIISIILLFLILDFWNEMSRKYYCLTEDKCITVWKRSDGYCYIIPGKYTSWFKPKDNYIKADNLDDGFGIYWFNNNPKEIIVDSYNYSIVNNNKDNIQMLEYNKNPKYFENLLYDADGLGDLYLKGTVSKLLIDIKDGYAFTNDGRKL
ncbi:hypothetical protein Ga0061079_1199 [Apibacter mensalis]|uniref:Uncharacterized protein n=1 Tax=Apibacter mensalis TaxID=1586267 RepID=A0A0X3AS65_9FLAO|nr:hypothetical protein [Apibacter mensalis]CVK17182.1 hypothetical protein Ga0061079_1199 [Apibacter mensalis]